MVGYVHIAIWCFRRFLPIFADFWIFLQNFANFGKIFGLIFRARWAVFRIFDPKSWKTRSGRPFRAPGVLFSDSSRFSHEFGLIFVDVLAIWAVFGRFFGFLGRFPAKSHQNMQLCCFAKHSHHTPIWLHYTILSLLFLVFLFPFFSPNVGQ